MRTFKIALRTCIASLGLVAAVGGGQAVAAVPSDTFTVSGQVNHAQTFSYTNSPLPLAGLPAITESGLVTAGSYTGVSMYGLLSSSAVGIKADPLTSKNSFLSQYVMATGSDGYRVVFSGGELDPSFGGSNTARPDLVAYQLNGGAITTNGAFRTVVPGDSAKAGRFVSNLVDLSIQNTAPKTAGGNPAQFTLSGSVANSGATYTSLADLTAGGLATITENVTFTSGANNTVNNLTFTGVSLWSFLNHAGILPDPLQTKNNLSLYVLATGSDGYKSVFSMGELDPSFGGAATNSLTQDLIAYTTDGTFRIVVPGDIKGGRYVSNLVSLEVLVAAAPVPEPAEVALLLAGLGVLAMVRRRQTRRPARVASVV